MKMYIDKKKGYISYIHLEIPKKKTEFLYSFITNFHNKVLYVLHIMSYDK